MNDPLFLLVGPSGSGKTTVSETLAKNYGYPTVESYTTRPRRYDGETGHTFITEAEFDELNNIIAYTTYNGFGYCTTKDQLDLVSTYVVDLPGVETLLQNYKTDRPIVIFYFNSTVTTRINRMLDRHDSDTAIVGRLHNDEAFDWYDKLDHIVWHYTNIEHKNVELYKIDANKSKEEVLEMVLYYMKRFEEAC